jgi:hypothetical protein
MDFLSSARSVITPTLLVGSIALAVALFTARHALAISAFAF